MTHYKTIFRDGYNGFSKTAALPWLKWFFKVGHYHSKLNRGGQPVRLRPKVMVNHEFTKAVTLPASVNENKIKNHG
jgi:hypothetical protein